MEIMIKKIFKEALIAIAILGGISFFFTEWRFPLSVIIGGIIFLASLWSISWAVKRFLGKAMAQPIIIGISSIKILFIFAILVILALLKLIDVIGLVTGFVVSLIITLKEGFITVRHQA